MERNSEKTKIFQPVEVTEKLQKEYDSLRLTAAETKTIFCNMTTRVFLNGKTPPASQN